MTATPWRRRAPCVCTRGIPRQGGVATGADVALPALGPGQQAVVTLLWDSLDKEGVQTLNAVVDPDSAVAELSELDNQVSVEIEVLPAPAGAELELRDSDLLITPSQPTELPAALGIAAAVRNLGQRRRRRGDGAPAGGAVRRGNLGRRHDGHRAGAVLGARDLRFTLTTPGLTRFTVVADPDDAIVEDDETNNAASRTLATGATVDLEVTAADLELEGTPYLGGDVCLPGNGAQPRHPRFARLPAAHRGDGRGRRCTW